MDGSLELLGVLAGLYLLECLRRVRPGDLILDRRTWGGFAIKRPILYPGKTWGWVLLNPLRPDGPVFLLPRPVETLDQSRFDVGAIRKAYSRLRTQTRGIRRVGVTLFAICFGVFPTFLLRYGFGAAWLPAVSGVLLCSVCSAALYRKAALVLTPCSPALDLPGGIARLVLYPIAAIRCADLLDHRSLSCFDPIAVAAALVGKKQAAKLVAEELVLLRFSAPPSEADFPNAREVRAYRSARRQLLESFSARHGLQLDVLLEPPSPSGGACKTYCPRCGAQYKLAGGSCTDCREIVLQALNTSPATPGNAKPPRVKAPVTRYFLEYGNFLSHSGPRPAFHIRRKQT